MRALVPSILIAATAAQAAASPEDNLFDLPIVQPNDNVSLRLKAVSQNDEFDLFTTADSGPASLQLNNDGTPSTLGPATNGNFDIIANWREFFESGSGQGEPSRLRFDISTSSGDPFISESDAQNGFTFVRWEIGDHTDPADNPFADAIDFRSVVESVTLVEATAVFFQDQTALNTVKYGFTIAGNGQWTGTDAAPGNIFSIGRAVNRIEITYDYTPIPAPAGVAAFAAAGLIASRRRR